MNDRHASLGRNLQALATEWAQKLVEEGQPMTPSDVVRWAEAGVRIERLALGQATSRTEVNYNRIAAPILALFQQIVQPALPEPVRAQVVRDFADGVNEIRDNVSGDEGKRT